MQKMKRIKMDLNCCWPFTKHLHIDFLEYNKKKGTSALSSK